MSTQKSKSEYLVLCRGISWDEVLSPEEIEKALGSFYAWFERLSNEGKMRIGSNGQNCPLEELGVHSPKTLEDRWTIILVQGIGELDRGAIRVEI